MRPASFDRKRGQKMSACVRESEINSVRESEINRKRASEFHQLYKQTQAQPTDLLGRYQLLQTTQTLFLHPSCVADTSAISAWDAQSTHTKKPVRYPRLEAQPTHHQPSQREGRRTEEGQSGQEEPERLLEAVRHTQGENLPVAHAGNARRKNPKALHRSLGARETAMQMKTITRTQRASQG